MAPFTQPQIDCLSATGYVKGALMFYVKTGRRNLPACGFSLSVVGAAGFLHNVVHVGFFVVQNLPVGLVQLEQQGEFRQPRRFLFQFRFFGKFLFQFFFGAF